MHRNQLKKFPFFKLLPDEEIQGLLDSFKATTYPAGKLLFMEGDPGESFSLVLSGEIEIVKALGSPEERVLAVVEAGDYLGEMSLLNPEGQRSASARARTPVQLMEMTRTDFEALVRKHPRLAFEFTREMSARLRSSENATIRDLQAKNRQLAQAYQELKAAQEQLVEQEKLAHELEIARQIQASLLPKQLPAIPGWQVSVYWQPARAVGGDFYDFIVYPDGLIGMVIADVSGKGVPAALVMATTRSVFRASAERLVAPGAVLERVNELLCTDMPPNMFVTCLYILLDPASGAMEFANAGHNLPCLCSPEEVVEPRATGMPLGLLPGMHYEQGQARLTLDDTLLMYSDGLTESHSPDREMFGVGRLRACLSDARTAPARDQAGRFIPYLLAELAAFTGPEWEQEDDVTLLSLETAR